MQSSGPGAAIGLGSASSSSSPTFEVSSQPVEEAVSSPQPAALSDSPCAPSASSAPELMGSVNDAAIAKSEGDSDAMATTTGGDTSGAPTRPEPEPEGKANVESTCVCNEKLGDTSSPRHEDMDVEDTTHTNPRSEKADEHKMDVDDKNTHVIEDTADEMSPKTGTAPENTADVSVASEDSNVSHDVSSSDPKAKSEATVLTSGDSSAHIETANEGSSSSSDEEDEALAEAAAKRAAADANVPSANSDERPTYEFAGITEVTAAAAAGGVPFHEFQSLQRAANVSGSPAADWSAWSQGPASLPPPSGWPPGVPNAAYPNPSYGYTEPPPPPPWSPSPSPFPALRRNVNDYSKWTKLEEFGYEFKGLHA